MASAPVVALTPAQVTSFHTRGYLVIENLLPQPVLDALRKESGRLLRAYRDCGAIEQEAGCILEPLGAVMTQGRVNAQLARSSAEYLELRARFNGGQVGEQFLFSPLLRSVLFQLMGRELYLFNEQYIVKTPNSGDDSKFVLHQDCQYVPQLDKNDLPPYVSVWCALDDMSEDNGCLYILPYPPSTLPHERLSGLWPFSTPMSMARHHLEKATAYPPDVLGGSGEVDGEIPMLMNAGSVVIMSHLVYHRSGANLSDESRRAYMPQFSWSPIATTEGSTTEAVATQTAESSRSSVSTRNVAFAVPLPT